MCGILYELLIKKDRYGGLSILLRQIHRVDDYSFCIFHFSGNNNKVSKERSNTDRVQQLSTI